MINFKRETGHQQVNVILPVPGRERQFLVVIDWKGQGDHGIETLRGATPGRNNPTNNHTFQIENGKGYALQVGVKHSGKNVSVKAKINGELLFDWRGPETDLDNPYWPTKNKRAVGISSGSGNGGNLVIRYSKFIVKPNSDWGWKSPPRGLAVVGASGPAIAANTPGNTNNTNNSNKRTPPNNSNKRTPPNNSNKRTPPNNNSNRAQLVYSWLKQHRDAKPFLSTALKLMCEKSAPKHTNSNSPWH
ncbi:MAG: hypothetical protein CMJ78_15985 [Planctomycetaceae bacterium]|nr:hypothetical protein [Planctomycetaceae bacterium]